MKAPTISLVSGFIFIVSCFGCQNEDNCAGYACMPPPSVEISFKVSNAQGENLLASGTLTADDIQLIQSGSQPVKPYIPDDKSAFAFDFPNGEWNYVLIVADSEFNLIVNVVQGERKSGECCAGFQVDSFIIDGQEISITSNNIINLAI